MARKKSLNKRSTRRPAKADPLILSREVQVELALFLQHNPPKEFNRNLRSMLIAFMTTQLGGVSDYTERLLIELNGLFTVLDKAEDDWKKTDLSDIWRYRDS